MTENSGLQSRLLKQLTPIVPQLQATANPPVFTRTRTQNPTAPKWVVELDMGPRKKPVFVQSRVPARDLVKSTKKLVVLSHVGNTFTVGFEPELDGIIAELQATELWVPRVQKAIERTLAEIRNAQTEGE